VHNDNPAEELNYLGDVSTPNTKWYGYPACFTVWSPSLFTDKTFAIGDQFVQAPNATFDDASCVARSTPPRLSFQAHSAPLDSQFDPTFSTLYVSFHGSWNRPSPTGFKLVAVPFTKGTDGTYAPTAAANSGSGYTDIFWNTNTASCPSSCFRPVGIAISGNRLFLTSDAGGEGELFILGKI
jgi:glucose/arabinose dehydrogenase